MIESRLLLETPFQNARIVPWKSWAIQKLFVLTVHPGWHTPYCPWLAEAMTQAGESIYSGHSLCWICQKESRPPLQRGKQKKKSQALFSTPGIPTVFTGIPNPILLGYISKQSVSFYPLHWKLVQNLLILSSSGPLLNLPERCSCCCIIARCRGVPGRGFRRGWLVAGKG